MQSGTAFNHHAAEVAFGFNEGGPDPVSRRRKRCNYTAGTAACDNDVKFPHRELFCRFLVILHLNSSFLVGLVYIEFYRNKSSSTARK